MLNWLLIHSPLLYLTQSLWRDEAFSILVAQKPISFLSHVTLEPPFYYFLLHFWMKIFGTSEIAARSLSLLGFALAACVVIVWAEKIYQKHWLSWFLPLFFLVNPMLLYYAFEVRTYGWYVFFAALSLYAYKEKKWVWFILATTLGIYTHTYMLFIPLVETIHFIITERKKLYPGKIINESFFRSLIAIALLVSPLLLRFGAELGTLKSSWYFPVDLQLIKSVLGNIFLGYEGTPGYLWMFTRIISLILLGFFVLAFKNRQHRQQNLLFALVVFIPLITVLGISFIKPIFVNRYLITVAIAEIFLVAAGLDSISNAALQKISAAILLIFVIGFNLWYPNKHAKLDIRTPIGEINMLKSPQDIILAETPLIYFETLYYSRDPNRVFLYNPNDYPFPWYVGGAIISKSSMMRFLPGYPTRAFLVHEDATFDIVYSRPDKTQIKK